VLHEPVTEQEADVPGETTNKALPALQFLNEILGEEYVFQDSSLQTTWNEDELDG
jgi:hypothetical protein